MKKWDKKEVIKELKKRAKELGHSPKARDLNSNIVWACQYYFGSFNKAKISAKLDLNSKSKKLNKNYYLPSLDIGYILGVVYGDGNVNIKEKNEISNTTYGKIQLKVKDEDFALYFKEVLEKWSRLKTVYYEKKGFYYVVLNSILTARFINNFNLNKILKWKKEFQFQFLKGLFDSEGGIFGINLDKRRYAKRWLHFSNNNLILIKLVKNIFDRMKIKYSFIKRIHSGFGSKKWQYEIKIYNLKDIFKYYKYVGFSIKRKQDKLNEVINSYEPKNLMIYTNGGLI